MEGRIEIGPDGNSIAEFYCLRTDIWQDYLTFMQEAEAAFRDGRNRDSNRYLRAAITCLFSHLEGVATEITSQRRIPNVFDDRDGRILCEKTKNIARAAGIDHINFRLGKELRNAIAHPGDDRYGYTDGQVFDKLTIENVRSLERKIGPWLDAVCAKLQVPRFTDTAELSRAFGELGPSSTREV